MRILTKRRGDWRGGGQLGLEILDGGIGAGRCSAVGTEEVFLRSVGGRVATTGPLDDGCF